MEAPVAWCVVPMAEHFVESIAEWAVVYSCVLSEGHPVVSSELPEGVLEEEFRCVPFGESVCFASLETAHTYSAE